MDFKEPGFVVVGRETILAPNLIANLGMFSHTPRITDKPSLKILVRELIHTLSHDSFKDSLITSVEFYLHVLRVSTNLKLSAQDWIEFFSAFIEYMMCDQSRFARDLAKICGEVIPQVKFSVRGAA